MPLGAPSFETGRLAVHGWHDRPPPGGRALDEVVGDLLGPEVRRWLGEPAEDAGARSRGAAWIARRDADAESALVTDRPGGRAVGLAWLTPYRSGSGFDVLLGYLVAEAVWGRGLATELVGGLVAWAEAQPPVRAVAARVHRDNLASARVLQKHGFTGSPWPMSEDLVFRRAVAARAAAEPPPPRPSAAERRPAVTPTLQPPG